MDYVSWTIEYFLPIPWVVKIVDKALKGAALPRDRKWIAPDTK
jgi:hypothetical protein